MAEYTVLQQRLTFGGLHDAAGSGSASTGGRERGSAARNWERLEVIQCIETSF